MGTDMLASTVVHDVERDGVGIGTVVADDVSGQFDRVSSEVVVGEVEDDVFERRAGREVVYV